MVNEKSLENLKKGHKPFDSEDGRKNQPLSVEARLRNTSIRDGLKEYLVKTKVTIKKTGEQVTLQEATIGQIANGMAAGDIDMLNIGLKVLGEFSEKRELTGPAGTPLFQGFKDVLPQVDNIEELIASQEAKRNKEE